MTQFEMSVFGMPLAWLPNQDGFRFIGVVLNSRKQVECVVEKDASGTHRIKGYSITELSGWKEYA